MKTKKLFKDYTEDEVAKYRFNFVKNTLRKASYRWPWRNIAVQLARVDRGIYECNICHARVKSTGFKIDHILPVVRPSRGFVTWGEYILNMFPMCNGYQVLCTNCHDIKTRGENERRKETRAKVRSGKATNGTPLIDSSSGNSKGNGKRKG